jgi:hypothetical protein
MQKSVKYNDLWKFQVQLASSGPEDGSHVDSIPNRRMMPSGMLRRVALLRTDVSEELCASIIRMTRIGELGTALAVAKFL